MAKLERARFLLLIRFVRALILIVLIIRMAYLPGLSILLDLMLKITRRRIVVCSIKRSLAINVCGGMSARAVLLGGSIRTQDFLRTLEVLQMFIICV